jgi:hypothetical protein
MSEVTKELIVASGSIISTVASGMIGSFLKEHSYTKKFSRAHKDIRNRLNGMWKGEILQDLLGQRMIFEVVKMELKAKPNGSIEGTMGVKFMEEFFDLSLIGGLYSENRRFIRLSYQNKDKGIEQFGAFVLQLHGPGGRELRGNFVGFGHVSQMIIAGGAAFTKIGG